MPANQCTCSTNSKIKYTYGDYCPVCNTIAKGGISLSKCNCDKMHEVDTKVTYASAKKQFYPKGDANIKKTGKDMEKIPSNDITGATFANAVADQQVSQTKPKKSTPAVMKEPKDLKL